LLDKYESHRPTNRYLEHLKNFGISIPQGTVTDGLKKLMPLFEPVINEFYKKSQLESHWHADETRWEVYESIEGKNTYRWYLWVFKSKSVVCYILDPSRGYSVPDKFFQDVKGGILNCDRYVVYKKLANNSDIILAFCWAHVRRDFLDCAKSYPLLEGWALAWVNDIGNLYHLNKERLSIAADTIERAIVQNKLERTLKDMEDKYLLELQDKKLQIVSRNILISLRNHWHGLIIFAQNSEVPMDNNTAESSLRGPVLGRKNYSGSGSIWSAQLASMMFSIIQTIKMWGANPLDWFNCYLRACAENGNKPPNNLDFFLPWEVVKGKNDSAFMKSLPSNTS
jgi:transposase